MTDILPRFKRLWLYVRGGIAFTPTVWVLSFIAFAFVMRYLEYQGLSDWLREQGDFWRINAAATARTILSSIIGGVISLTVFSFSMVMIVLGQATSTLSPRLLPQLIRDRSHQNTLGLYLGVIMYCYITMIAINPDEEWKLNSFSIFVAVVLAIVCLGFFVFFIASISRRIQVGEVVKDVHRRAVTDIRTWQAGSDNWSLRGLPENVEDWHYVKATESGYVDATLYEELSHLGRNIGTRIYLERHRSSYVVRGSVLFRAERPLTNEERKKAAEILRLNDNRDKEFWYYPAIRHITEVAVKAMSPGINDPGTAIEAINLLSDLFVSLSDLPRLNHYQDGADGGDVFFVSRSLEEIVSESITSIRTYAKADPAVMMNLQECLMALLLNTQSSTITTFAKNELKALKEDGANSIGNSQDRQAFLSLFD